MPPALKSKSRKSKPQLGVSFVVSARQPYVMGYEDWPNGIEWLCAAVADQYIPLLNLLNRLIVDGIEPAIGVCLNPLLCEMLADLEFAPQFQVYIQDRIDAAAANQAAFATEGLSDQRDLALFWQSRDTNIARDFDQTYGGDLVGAFRELQDKGHIELLAAPITGDRLGAMEDIRAIRGQIIQGIESYKKHFARTPHGMAVSDNAFSGGKTNARKVASGLAEEGVDYALLLESNRPANRTEPVGPVAWTRLADTPLIGCTTAMRSFSCQCDEAAQSFLDPAMRYYPGGHPYWRRGLPETDPSEKPFYDPTKVPESCETLATQFIDDLYEKWNGHANAVVVALEFPGPGAHGLWLEWNRWFYRVLRKAALNKKFQLQTGETIAAALRAKDRQELPAFKAPTRSAKQRNAPANWTWRHVRECQEAQARLVGNHGATRNPKLRQILEQCERELALLQAGDWQTLLNEPAARDYAVMRFARHKHDFEHLAELASKIASGRFLSEGERTYVARLAQRDRCFQEISLRHWTA